MTPLPPGPFGCILPLDQRPLRGRLDARNMEPERARRVAQVFESDYPTGHFGEGEAVRFVNLFGPSCRAWRTADGRVVVMREG